MATWVNEWSDGSFTASPAETSTASPAENGGDSPSPSSSVVIAPCCGSVTSDPPPRALRKQNVVLGPAADGGYYLVGIRGPWQSRRTAFESLFRDIPWSSENVLNITRQRLVSAGLAFSELETLEDIDTIAELNQLRDRLAAGDSHRELRGEIERILNDTSLADQPLT